MTIDKRKCCNGSKYNIIIITQFNNLPSLRSELPLQNFKTWDILHNHQHHHFQDVECVVTAVTDRMPPGSNHCEALSSSAAKTRYQRRCCWHRKPGYFGHILYDKTYFSVEFQYLT